MMRFVAIVPARAGSNSIPRKNLALLNGQPLLSYTLTTLLNSRLKLSSYVCTDDPDIAHLARSYQISVVDQPLDLARDQIPLEKVVLHVLSTLDLAQWDAFILLQPNHPFRTVFHIEKALEIFENSTTAHSLMSVVPIEPHLAQCYHTKHGLLEPLGEIQNVLNNLEEEIPIVFRQNRAIYISRIDAFLERKNFYLSPCLPFLMSTHEGEAVCTSWDLKMAEFWMKEKTNKS